MKINKTILAITLVVAVFLGLVGINTSSILAQDDILIVTIGDVKAKPGETVEIPITFTNVPDNAIVACDFELGFDPDAIEVNSAIPGNIVEKPNKSFDTSICNDKGFMVFLFCEDSGTGAESIYDDGKFATVNMTIKKDAPSGKLPIEIIKVGAFGDNDIQRLPYRIVSGSVEIANGEVLPTDPEPEKTPAPTEQPMPGSEGEHKPYLSGYPGGLFKPENNITRAEAAVIFARLLDMEPETAPLGNKIAFSDVNEEHWSAWAIRCVTDEGLFSGYTDGTFMPDKSITRAEFATVVCNYLKNQGIIGDEIYNIDTLVDTKGHWAQGNIEILVSKGYIKGYPDNTFRPNANIKRAESVALINRALQRGPLYDAILDFTDVPNDYWAYKDIAEGVIHHRYRINEAGNEVMINNLTD